MNHFCPNCGEYSIPDNIIKVKYQKLFLPDNLIGVKWITHELHFCSICEKEYYLEGDK